MGGEEGDRCFAAFGATYEILAQSCGDRSVKVIPIGDQSILVEIPNPSPDPDVGGEKLTMEEREKAIEESRWAVNEARGLCTKLFGVEEGADGFDQCVKNVAHRLAVGMIH